MSSQQKKNCFVSTLITLIVAGGVGFGVWWFVGKPSVAEIGDYFGDLGNEWDSFWESDPFGGSANNDPDGALLGVWPNKGKGLKLSILNALDDTWTREFEEAIANWETGGQPDVMTLTIERVAVEPGCSQQSDVMKVCNDNYGETGWLGINELFTNTITNIIQSSVAKMNEFYLLDADYDERLYTMCHEIGHGFGLPHTDENFNNLDLGNCLDYSHFPSNNLDPGQINFDKLLNAYGPLSRRLMPRPINERQTLEENQRSMAYKQAMTELEDQLLKEYQGEEAASSEWRMVRRLARGEHYIRELGDGYQIEASVLRPIVRNE